MLSQSQRREIVGRSRTLSERLATDAATVDDLPEHVDEWVTAWRTRFGDEAWRSRIERVGVAPRELPDRLVGEPAEEPLPGWVDELTTLTAALAEREPHVPDGKWDPETPFVHVLVPVVEHASEPIDWPAWLSADGTHDLEAALAERLERMFAHPLFVDFKYYLSQHDDDPGAGDEQYRAFVERQLSDGLASFFHEYAFLGRLTAAVIDGWRRHVEQFLARLADDRAVLAETFGVGSDAQVTGIEPLGDPHAGGKRVFGVTFDTGDRLAYKPRPVGPEATFDAVVAWCNEAGTLPSLRRLRTVQRADYGWVEWVTSAPCDSRAGANLFYRRVGVLTAVLYALDFSDGHVENLIAAGDQPVVVDLETLAQPVARLGDGDDPAADAVRDSVLATGLIPRFLPEASLRNAAGLNSDETVDTNASTTRTPTGWSFVSNERRRWRRITSRLSTTRWSLRRRVTRRCSRGSRPATGSSCRTGRRCWPTMDRCRRWLTRRCGCCCGQRETTARSNDGSGSLRRSGQVCRSGWRQNGWLGASSATTQRGRCTDTSVVRCGGTTCRGSRSPATRLSCVTTASRWRNCRTPRRPIGCADGSPSCPRRI
jgi:hypothetical protein